MPDDEILIEPEFSWEAPAEHIQELIEELVEDVRSLGQDASVAYPAPTGSYGATTKDLTAVPWGEVFIWIGSTASEAVIAQVVGVAVSWMRERFRKNPDRKSTWTGEELHIPQGVWIIRDEGDTGTPVVRVELESPDAKPVRLLPKDPGEYTRTKPLRTKLEYYRRGAGLTQAELADEAGVSQATVGMIERGKRPKPHPRTLTKLAEALGISAADLLDD
jgi:DNA-binding XRE family transcriptional regulator